MFSSASIAHTPAYALPEGGASGERAAEGKCASTMFVKTVRQTLQETVQSPFSWINISLP